MNTDTGNSTNSRITIVLIAFAAIGAFLLLAEHRAHVLPFLPWLFLAACPLMHIFMHRGHAHGSHSDGDARDDQGTAPRNSSAGESAAHSH